MLWILVCSTVSRNKVASVFETVEELGRTSFFSRRTINCQIKWPFSLFLSFYPVDSYLIKISFLNCEWISYNRKSLRGFVLEIVGNNLEQRKEIVFVVSRRKGRGSALEQLNNDSRKCQYKNRTSSSLIWSIYVLLWCDLNMSKCFKL